MSRLTCSESRLGRRAGRSPDDGGCCSRSRCRASAKTPTSADAAADDQDEEQDDEGRPSDVESPAGHGGPRVQLGEVLELGEIRLMESEFADMLQGLTHLFHLAGGHEGDGVPVPLEVQDAIVESDRPIRGDQMVGKNALAARRNVQLFRTLFEMHLGGNPVPTLDVDGGVVG
jgi:hypothetical protein